MSTSTITSTIPVMRPALGEAEAEAAAEAVRSGWVAQGPRVAAFEAAFARYVGAADAVAVSSCTAGLHLSLHVLALGPGDEVVVPSFSFIATANAVRYTGATPVFADVDIVTGNVTAETVRAALTERTRAVIVVHQGGVPCDVPAVAAVCDPAGVAVVEDAACAAGSTLRGRPVGADSRLAAWSFHPRKVLTTGEGGMVTTSDALLAARLRRLREHGMDVSAAQRHAANRQVQERYLETGFNYRMTDIQAAVGLVQLARLDAMVARRRALAAGYHEMLAPIPNVRPVTDPGHGTTNYQSYWVELLDGFPLSRDRLIDAMNAAGISPRRGIMAAHLEPAYEGHRHGPLPVTERLTSRTLILPLFDSLTADEQRRVVDVIAAAHAGPDRAGNSPDSGGPCAG